MTTKRIPAFAMVVAVGLTACSGANTETVENTIDDAAAAAVETAEAATDSTLAPASAEAIAKLQTSLDVLTSELDEAELDPTLEVAWSELRARITDAVSTVEADGNFDLAALEDSLDSFEGMLDVAESDPELHSAWDEFRAALTGFLAERSG